MQRYPLIFQELALQIDLKYYKEQQIMPTLGRICEYI